MLFFIQINSIGKFSDCTNLISASTDATNIHNNAFYFSNMMTIGESAFSLCRNLNCVSIRLFDVIEKIAFSQCII